MLSRFAGPPFVGKGRCQLQSRHDIVRIDFQRLVEQRNRSGRVAAPANECHSRPKVVVVVKEICGNSPDGAGRDVDELRNVGRSVRSREPIEHHRHTAVALLVDMREEKLRVRRKGLGREHQPLAVGRPAMPRVHPRRITLQLARLAAGGRDDPESAVRLQEHEASGPAEDNPLAIGREPRKIVALAVARSSFKRLRNAAPAFIERNAIEVESKRLVPFEELPALFGAQQGSRLVAQVRQLMGLAPCKDQVFAVRAPDGIALDEPRVVGPGKGRKLLRLPIVDGQDSLDRKEELAERQVAGRNEDGTILHRAHNVSAIG